MSCSASIQDELHFLSSKDGDPQKWAVQFAASLDLFKTVPCWVEAFMCFQVRVMQDCRARMAWSPGNAVEQAWDVVQKSLKNRRAQWAPHQRGF